MMTGIVNVDLEAVLRLSVRDAAGHSHDVEAVIDTGFNGFLTLPPALVAALQGKGDIRKRGHKEKGT
jgi:predicted aspartyl protease